jgi:hypothetical protein
MRRKSWKAIACMGTFLLCLAGCESVPPKREPDPDSLVEDSTTIIASDAQDNDRFGWSVDFDGNSLVVGTNPMFASGIFRGKAYVYSRNQGGTDNWGEVRKLAAGDIEDYDLFGYSVSVDGDSAMVGAFSEDGLGVDRGAAYIYSRNLGGADRWGESKKIAPAEVQDWDRVGYSVALDGERAIIGAPYKLEAGLAYGAAFVFDRDRGGPGNWGEVKKITANDIEPSDAFGYSVAIDGDTALVGSLYENGAGYLRGAAYVFYRDQGGADNWGEVKKLTAFDAEDQDQFGISVAILGDLAIVGADWKHEAGDEKGAAYIFGRHQGGADNWGLVKKLSASDGAYGDAFGISVSISEEYAIVGAPGNSTSIVGLGAVYVFQRNLGGADNWGEAGKIVPVDANESCWFGWSTALAGDMVAVGAPVKRGAGSERGAVYVIRLKTGAPARS